MLGYHIYRQFNGIWRYIDDNDYLTLNQVMEHVDAESLNTKQQGYSPLYLACVRRNLPIMELLLRSGADPDLPSRNKTPLLLSTLYGEYEMVQLLLRYGAKPNTLCKEIGPMHLAASKGIVELCLLLWQYDADVSLLSKKYGTPLHVAIKLDHKFIADFLISHGARYDLTNNDGETPLHLACRLGREKILKDILNTNIKPSIFKMKETSEGFNVAHTAAAHGKINLLKLIVSKDPSILTEIDDKGRTALFQLSPIQRPAIRAMLTNMKKSEGFAKLFDNRHNADITVNPQLTNAGLNKVEPVYSHKSILWARWPNIRTKLDSLPNQKNLRIQNLDVELDNNILREFIRFLYTDQIQIYKNGYSTESIQTLEKLRSFAYNQSLYYLVTLCNSNLLMLSKESNGQYSMDYSHQEALISFKSTLQDDISQLVNNPKFSDVTFNLPIIEEQASNFPRTEVFYAHKAILSSKCEYFAAMFDPSRALIESRLGNITLEGYASSSVLNVIIDYLYTGNVPTKNIISNYVTNLLEVTTWMMLPKLQNIIEIFVIENLLEGSVVYDLIEYAFSMNWQLLKEECLDYLVRHYHFVSHKEEYSNLDHKIQDEVRSTLYDL